MLSVTVGGMVNENAAAALEHHRSAYVESHFVDGKRFDFTWDPAASSNPGAGVQSDQQQAISPTSTLIDVSRDFSMRAPRKSSLHFGFQMLRQVEAEAV